MYVLFYLFIMLNMYCNSYKMIKPKQWEYLNYYIKNPHTTPSMKEKITFIIYKRYTPMVYKLYNDFHIFHKHKCNLINKEDLLQYAFMGLIHAIKNYNGNSIFYRYATIYVKGALHEGLSVHFPISKRSKHERKKKIYKPFDFETSGYVKEYNNMYIGKNNYLKSTITTDHESFWKYYHMWVKINELPAFSKYIMHNKFSYYFDVVRSNRELSQLCCCSEETIRQRVHSSIIKITNY